MPLTSDAPLVNHFNIDMIFGKMLFAALDIVPIFRRIPSPTIIIKANSRINYDNCQHKGSFFNLFN